MKNFSERAESLFRRGYGLVFAFVFVCYDAAAFLPAVLMHRGHRQIAKLIYRLFSFLCHQLPYRSFFLFGPRFVYPLNGPGSLAEAAAGALPGANRLREFIGTEAMGWKTAICQRCIAIYLAMAVFCLIFFLSRNRIKAVKTLPALVFGALPMALDGGSQAVGKLFPGTVLERESTPLLRCLTGALFGFFLCWYLLPRIEESLRYGENE